MPAAVQQGGVVDYWGSVRDVVFRQLDADGEVMQGTGLRVQLPGTSLCSEVTSAIRAAGQVGLVSLLRYPGLMHDAYHQALIRQLSVWYVQECLYELGSSVGSSPADKMHYL